MLPGSASQDDSEAKRRRLEQLIEEENRLKRERVSLGIVDVADTDELKKLLIVQSQIMNEMRQDSSRRNKETAQKDTFMRIYQNEMVHRMEEMAKQQQDMLSSYSNVTAELKKHSRQSNLLLDMP